MKKIIIGITGASGVIYSIKLLEFFKKNRIKTYVIVSDAAKKIIDIETEYKFETIVSLSDFVYNNNEMEAKIASGSFLSDGMIVIPCSIKTLSAVANSYNNNLITRAADVTLKEGRKLVMMIRETPFHKGHLKLMLKVADNGACILPAIPAFYHRPKTIEDIINQTLGKICDYLQINNNLFKRWNGIDFKAGQPTLFE
ncbi:MAG: UbiX family flavin prenyltransferase [Deltaproteobacteria bacterium]|nr:UbiX family flavin prenyltransferase [Deltaproteobacteria bacterium]